MFGLTRIVLSNSYFIRKVVCFDTDGHSNASGGNSAGKTSALNLIPVFYGVEPNQLVQQVANKKSFIDFYLPEQSSALIYEHRRDDGFRCVVMHRSDTGARVIYRHLHGSLEDSFFHPDIKPMINGGETLKDILSALSDRGVAMSRQIVNITDYRASIQNDQNLQRGSGRDSALFRSLAREYCLGGASEKSRHLDRMAYSVLRRADMFDRLKQMIAETQFQDVHIDDKPRHLKEKSMVADVQGLRDFTATAPALRATLEQHAERQLVLVDAKLNANSLAYCLQQAASDLTSKKASFDDLIAEKGHAQLLFERERASAKENLADLNAEIDTLTSTIDLTHQQKQDWEDEDITRKRAELKNVGELASEKFRLERNVNALNEKIDNIEQQRLKATAELEEEFSVKFKKLSAQQLKLKDKRHDEQMASNDSANKLHSDEISERDAIDDGEHRDRLNSLGALLAEAEHEAKRCVRSEGDQNNIDALDGKRWAQQQLVNEAMILQSRSESEFSHQNDLINAGLIIFDKMKATCRKALSSRDAMRARLYADGTLLSNLREQDPEWGATIGRIINPELLGRKDLSPVFDAKSPVTVFGWTLDVDSIEPPEWTVSKERLTEQLERHESTLRNAEEDVLKATSAAKLLQDPLPALRDAVTLQKYRVTQAKERLGILENECIDAKKAADYAAKQQQSAAKTQAAAIQQELKLGNAALQQMRQAIRDRYAGLRREAKGRFSILLSEIDAESDRLDDLEKRLSRDKKESETTIAARFNESCIEEGVDPAVISAAREKLKAHSRHLDEIRGYAEQISLYDTWLVVHWNTLSERVRRLSESTREQEEAQNTITRNKADYDKKVAALLSQIEATKLAVLKLGSQISNANEILTAFPSELSAEEAGEKAGEEVNQPIESLTDRLQALVERNNTLKKQILLQVDKARQTIAAHPQSKIALAWSYLQEQRRNSTTDGEMSDAFRLQVPNDIAALLDRELPDIKSALIESVRSVGDSLGRYHGTLQGLNARVSGVSSLLERHINTNQKIDTLSDIQLNVTSKIVEGDYWNKLQTFILAWNLWKENRQADDLPPTELLQALNTANEAIQASHIDKDINSLIKLQISLKENGRQAHADNSRDFGEISSNGLSYLCLLVIFIGMSRYLCPNPQVALHWPIDELASLSPENIARLFAMMDDAGLRCFSAFPSTDPNYLRFFKHCKLIDRSEGIRTVSIDETYADSERMSQMLSAINIDIGINVDIDIENKD
ncbi:MAG: hypothetical protein ACI9W6_000847 [Motiliproteus sp.]|jgi:hypothetical protein